MEQKCENCRSLLEEVELLKAEVNTEKMIREMEQKAFKETMGTFSKYQEDVYIPLQTMFMQMTAGLSRNIDQQFQKFRREWQAKEGE